MTTYHHGRYALTNGGSPQYTSGFVAEGCSQGLRRVSCGGADHLPYRTHYRRRRRQSRYSEAAARARLRRYGIALPFDGNAYRVVYALQIGNDICVVHAFQKKSTQGIKTPQREIELIKDRLKRLKEMLNEARKTRSGTR